jgi:hypothetical protein
MLGFLLDLYVAAVTIAAPVWVSFLAVAAAKRCRRRRVAARVDWDAELRELIP